MGVPLFFACPERLVLVIPFQEARVEHCLVIE